MIQQTIKQELPEGFQRSEFLLRKGMLDDVVQRRDLRDRLAIYIRMLRGGLREPSAEVKRATVF